MEFQELGESSVGRSYQAGRYSITKQTIKPFKEWMDDYSDFVKLPRPKKRMLFLRWKWGFTSPEVNEALEATRRMLIERVRMLCENAQEDTAWMADEIDKFENYCYKTMGEIGLVDNITLQQRQINEMVKGVFD